MTDEQQAAFDSWIEDLSRDAAPYVPRPGDRDPFADYRAFLGQPTREQKLADPIRAFTIDWLAWKLALASQHSFGAARTALVEAIPDGEEEMLDGGQGFLFAFDLAAFALDIDPYAISLHPERLHS